MKVSLYMLVLLAVVSGTACGLKNLGSSSLPAEVETAIATITDDLEWERYDKIYAEASSLWKRDSTLEESTEVLKKLRTQLGKVKNRAMNSATEQRNSGGPLQGHVFIISYQTTFAGASGTETLAAMETFTLLEEDGRWALARYFVNSTALK